LPECIAKAAEAILYRHGKDPYCQLEAMKGAKGFSDLASAAQHARDYFDSYANGEADRLLSG
jgi:hypothetical protein